MSGNLMDTNVIVRVLNGDRELVSKLSQIEELCSCTVVLGELLYGAEKSQRSEQNKQKAVLQKISLNGFADLYFWYWELSE